MLIFMIPLYVYVLVVYLIDPYNMLRIENRQTLVELKRKISNSYNYPLFKIIEYSNAPKENIILGDSRASKFTTELFQEIFHEDVYNMSYGGATLQEIIDTFNEISENHPLTKVYLCLNFNLYNKNNMRNRVPESLEIANSIGSYFSNKYTLKSTFSIVKYLLSGSEPMIEKPPFSEEEFWQYQLESAASSFYQEYSYPDNYFKDLNKISDFCKANNIELIIIIPPTHIDLQKRIGDFGLTEADMRFKEDMKEMAKLFDFDFPNAITQDRNNYLDPFHFKEEVAKSIILEVYNNLNSPN